MPCCAGFATILREANRDDRSGDLFGKLKADVKVTRQTRKRSAADALRILFVTRRGFCQRRYLLVEHKNRRWNDPVPTIRESLHRESLNRTSPYPDSRISILESLRRQRGAYPGFDQCAICDIDTYCKSYTSTRALPVVLLTPRTIAV